MLVNAFTAENGVVTGVMRGGRSSKRTSPQLFQPLMLDVAGKMELKTIRQAEPAGIAVNLQGVALFSALYLNELLVRLLPQDEPQPALFVAYVESLGKLSASNEPAPLLRCFETQLLEALGYGIDFKCDSESGEEIQADRYYAFHPEQGFYATAASHAVAKGEALLQIAQGRFSEAEPARVAKLINRLALKRLLGNRPLKSRELFLSFRSES
jgi:DNA repair protein RecO (recombination protein O)